MKKVLWLSRHEMTSEQEETLGRLAMDEIEIIKVDRTVSAAEEVIKLADDFQCDILAVVLPVGLLSKVYELKGDRALISARSKRELVKVDGEESKVAFKFDGWEVWDKVVIKSHIFY